MIGEPPATFTTTDTDTSSERRTTTLYFRHPLQSGQERTRNIGTMLFTHDSDYDDSHVQPTHVRAFDLYQPPHLLECVILPSVP